MKERTLGVVGTLVWDRIVPADPTVPPVEDWGGIAYALESLSASVAEGWTILPMLKVGHDLAREGLEYLTALPGVDVSSVQVVPEPNNRVELRYESRAHRRERLSGGVPGWTWSELAPSVTRCDAVYVNFISGAEMALPTARAFSSYAGPVFADLHSLFLGIDGDGMRVPQLLDEPDAWLSAFDAVQLNEDEFDLLADAGGDPWGRVSLAFDTRLAMVAVTLGPRGVAWATAPGFVADPLCWTERPTEQGSSTDPAPSGGSDRPPLRPRRLETPRRDGDPTGCGDVWGAATFARLLAGDGLEASMTWGNHLGGLNVRHRGTRGLRTLFSSARPPSSVEVKA